MGLYIGNQNIGQVFIGNNSIQSVYIGDQSIYENFKFSWSFDTLNKTATLTKYTNGSRRDVTIPNYVGYQGELYTVVGIGNEAFKNTNILSIKFPREISIIGEGAFWGCSLQYITIPASIENIPNSAFQSCTSLRSVTFAQQSSLRTIGSYSFYGCSALEGIILPNSVISIGTYSFYNCGDMHSITFGSNIGSIGKYAFGYCGLYSIDIPTTISSISEGMLTNCYRLSNITIPNNIININSNAFSYCDTLASVTIGSGVTSIDSYAFEGCANLRNINIPSNVTYLGVDVFSGCWRIGSMTLPFVGYETTTNTKYPLGNIFSDRSYTNSYIANQFYISVGQESREEYYIPYNLTNVTISGGDISYGAFSNCEYITGITLSDGVSSIGTKAFYGCYGLQNINIPASVNYIGSSVFYDCDNLYSNGITFDGTKEQWNSISKESDWDDGLVKPITIHCTNGSIILN